MQIIQVTTIINTEYADLNLVWKFCSSNLLVQIIYSRVALGTFVLASVSNELLPKRRVLIITGLQRCRRLLSMFSTVLRRVCLSVIYMGQWGESAQLIQYLSHNYRMGLKNLENYVWICVHVNGLNQAAV